MNLDFIENTAPPLLPQFRRGNSSEFENRITQLHLVRTEFPAVDSLAWNSDMSGSSLNTATIRDGQRIVAISTDKDGKTPYSCTKFHKMWRRREAEARSSHLLVIHGSETVDVKGETGFSIYSTPRRPSVWRTEGPYNPRCSPLNADYS